MDGRTGFKNDNKRTKFINTTTDRKLRRIMIAKRTWHTEKELGFNAEWFVNPIY